MYVPDPYDSVHHLKIFNESLKYHITMIIAINADFLQSEGFYYQFIIHEAAVGRLMQQIFPLRSQLKYDSNDS